MPSECARSFVLTNELLTINRADGLIINFLYVVSLQPLFFTESDRYQSLLLHTERVLVLDRGTVFVLNSFNTNTKCLDVSSYSFMLPFPNPTFFLTKSTNSLCAFMFSY